MKLLLLASVALGAGLPGSAGAQTVLAGHGLEQSARCEKGALLTITASDSRLSILGDCLAVVIEGDRNWIQVMHARSIVSTGNQNTILYADRTTRVEDKGKANSLAERWPQ